MNRINRFFFARRFHFVVDVVPLPFMRLPLRPVWDTTSRDNTVGSFRKKRNNPSKSTIASSAASDSKSDSALLPTAGKYSDMRSRISFVTVSVPNFLQAS